MKPYTFKINTNPASEKDIEELRIEIKKRLIEYLRENKLYFNEDGMSVVQNIFSESADKLGMFKLDSSITITVV